MHSVIHCLIIHTVFKGLIIVTRISTVLFFILITVSCLLLLRQIPSATWTSLSSTWIWTVSSTCPTSPPSGTHWRCSSRPGAELSRRKSLRAQCYDATEFPSTNTHTQCTHNLNITPHLFSLRTAGPLEKKKNRKYQEHTSKKFSQTSRGVRDIIIQRL